MSPTAAANTSKGGSNDEISFTTHTKRYLKYNYNPINYGISGRGHGLRRMDLSCSSESGKWKWWNSRRMLINPFLQNKP